jgi:polysaccharide biosynthesis protein PelG
MAGVGFGLRKLHAGETYTSLARLYASAGIISSGPWLISILTLLFVGLVGRGLAPAPEAVERFQVSVTWLFATSLVLSTPIQLLFTRYIADLLYRQRGDLALPSLWGALAIMTTVSFGVGCASFGLFHGESTALKVVLTANLVAVSDTWLVIVMLTALREHGKVIVAFLLGYGTTFGACLALARYGELGLLCGFLLGQSTLLFWSLGTVARAAPSSRAVAFGFLDRQKVHLDLLLIGLLYALGIWADKLVFWLHSPTSRAVLGPFRSSEVYDLPVFLAYLAITPGMAAFLLRIETDYAERHTAFFRAIEDGAPLARLERLRDELVESARGALLTIFKVQGITFVSCLLLGETLLTWFGISRLHLPLFFVDVAAVSMQVLVLSTISIFFYLDRRSTVLWLVTLLCATNLIGTVASLFAGSAFYGYGFAVAASLTTVAAVITLNRTYRHLLRDTFMMQG